MGQIWIQVWYGSAMAIMAHGVRVRINTAPNRILIIGRMTFTFLAIITRILWRASTDSRIRTTTQARLIRGLFNALNATYQLEIAYA